jgi:hypothetical protein
MMEVTGGMNCSSCSYPASVRIAVWVSCFHGYLQRLVPVLADVFCFVVVIKLEGGAQNFENNK